MKSNEEISDQAGALYAETRSIGEDRRPWILLGLGLFGVGIASWQPIPAGVWHDDGAYMLIGKALAGGHGFTYYGVTEAPPATKFPPVYPLVLAAIWTVTRSIGAATFAASFLNVGLIAAAGALFGRMLHRTAGLPLALSLAVAGLGFTSTDLVRTALIPLSEPLFLLLVVLALDQWSRVENVAGPTGRATGVRARWSGLVIPALLLLIVVGTRSAGLVLVLAFAVALLGRRPSLHRFGVTALVTGPALLFVLSWGRWSTAATEQIPEGARDLLGPYDDWLADQILSAPGTFLADLPAHTVGVFGRAIALLVPELVGAPMWIVGSLLLGLATIGTISFIRRIPPLGWLIPAYVAMLILWPYLDRRLLVPLHPMLVASIAVGGLTIFEKVSNGGRRRALLVAASVWVVGYTSVTAVRLTDGWPTAPYRVRAEDLAAAVEAMTRTVPDDAVVGAPEFWAALHLHGGWTVAPSVRFDPRSVDPETPMWGTPDEQLTLWQAGGIDHLLLEQGGQLHGAALDQLEAACPGSVLVLARMRVAMLVKLEWEATCRPVPPSTPRLP